MARGAPDARRVGGTEGSIGAAQKRPGLAVPRRGPHPRESAPDSATDSATDAATDSPAALPAYLPAFAAAIAALPASSCCFCSSSSAFFLAASASLFFSTHARASLPEPKASPVRSLRTM